MATAPAHAQAQLLDVQALDTRLGQIVYAKAHLPQLERLLQIAQESETLADLLTAAKTNASDISREQTRADGDVQAVRQRIEKDEKMLASGAVPAKDLEALQHELQSLARRQGELEDIELEIMERLDEATIAASRYQAQLEVLAQEQGELGSQVKAQLATLAEEVTAVQAERAQLVAQIPADLMSLYEKIGQDNPTAAALLQHGSCSGCRIALPATDLSHIREVGPDEIIRCDNCRCILVRTSHSGL